MIKSYLKAALVAVVGWQIINIIAQGSNAPIVRQLIKLWEG